MRRYKEKFGTKRGGDGREKSGQALRQTTHAPAKTVIRSNMDPHRQSPASEVMMLAMQSGESTCIDCHKGIAHHLPK
jgi:nitrate/TMAO reductase-like tetraheme cytochrome c subunit